MLFLGVLLASLLAALAPVDLAGASSSPVFAQDFPDPMVLASGGAFYAYSTETPWEKPGTLFPILRSTDLQHWTYVADALPGGPRWGMDEWWAPSVVERDGTFYLFYSGRNPAQVHCVAVATAVSPTGPFTDRGPLACGDAAGSGYIDAAPFIDQDGKGYLYFSVDNPHHSISVLPLSDDLLHASGPRTELFGVTQDWERGPQFTTVEGPFMVRHGGHYDLFYSANDWRHDYAEGVAVGDSPMGPFAKPAANPVLRGGGQLHGPGGGSLFTGPDGETWMAYHAWSNGGRSLHVERVCWADGRITVGC